MMKSRSAVVLALAAGLLLAAPAAARQDSLGPVTATISIEQVQAALIGSGRRWQGLLGADGVVIASRADASKG